MRWCSFRSWMSGCCFLVSAILVAPASVSAGVVAHWKLDDGQGDSTTTTAVDSVAPASDGTLENFPSPPTPKWTTGFSGGALEFGDNGNGQGADGDNVVTVPNPDGGKLDLTGAMTISSWVLLDEDGGRSSTRHIAGVDRAGGATGDGYSLKHNGSGGDVGKVAFLIAQSGDFNLVSSQTLPTYKAASVTAGNGGWVHLVGVFVPGTSMTLYVDGVQDAQSLVGVPTAIDSVLTPFNIGRLDNSANHSFHGAIDDVQLYDMALSASDVTFLFNNAGATVPEPSSILLGFFGLLGMMMTRRSRRS